MSKAYARWTEEENQILVQRRRQGQSFAKIGKELDRTENATRMQWHKLDARGLTAPEPVWRTGKEIVEQWKATGITCECGSTRVMRHGATTMCFSCEKTAEAA